MKGDPRWLVPLVKKFILPGTTVMSDKWPSYNSLGDEGFNHWCVNHSVNFVCPDNPEVHTQTVERLWLDFKQWTKRPGLRTNYMRQYVARYLFIRRTGADRQHEFLTSAGNLYPHSSTNSGRTNRPRKQVEHVADDSDNSDDEVTDHE